MRAVRRAPDRARPPFSRLLPAVVTATLTIACGDDSVTGNGGPTDATTERSVVEAAPPRDTAAPEARQDAGMLDSTVLDASSDASATDGPLTDGAGTDAPEDANAWDAGPWPSSLLQGGTNLVLGGVTSDDQVIYYDPSSQTYYAIPIGGGALTSLYVVAPSLTGGNFGTIGDVAVGFAANGSLQGPLWSWKSGMSHAATISSAAMAFPYQTVWASSDGRYVAYLEFAGDAGGSVNNLYGANVDGTGVTLLASNVDTYRFFYGGPEPGCFPRVVFQGDTAVVSYCSVSDAGAVGPVIQSFAADRGWTASVVMSNWIDSYRYNPLDRRPFTYPFAVDPDAGQIVAIAGSDGGSNLQVFSIDGGAGTALGPNAALSQGNSFAGMPTNPWSVVYSDDAGVLRQTYLADASSQVLVDGGVHYFDSISHNGQWMLVSSQIEPTGWFSDLNLVSTLTPGAPQLVASVSLFDGGSVTPSAQRSGGNGFTADDNYALMFTDVIRSNANVWIGHVRAMSVAPPYTTKLLSTGYAFDAAPITGSKVLLVDALQDTDGGAGSASTYDLDVVDVATGAPPVKIAVATPGSYGLSSDGSKIVYVVDNGPAPGIYVTAAP